MSSIVLILHQYVVELYTIYSFDFVCVTKCNFEFVVNFAVNLSSDCDDKLKIYRDNFEKAYLEATQAFYWAKAPEYLDANGVQNYMRYADQKLKEEEQRASRYLETRRDSKSIDVVC